MTGMQTIGTLDHFFDVADQLTALGSQFTLLVKHPNGDGILVLCNVEDETVAGHMGASMRHTLLNRFGANPDEDSDEEDFDDPNIPEEPSP